MWCVVLLFTVVPNLSAQGDGKTVIDSKDSKMMAPAPMVEPQSCFDGWYFGIHAGANFEDDSDFHGEGRIVREDEEEEGGVDVFRGRSRRFGDDDDDDNNFNGLAGLHMGRNWHHGNWVFGAELDLTATFGDNNNDDDGFITFVEASGQRALRSISTVESDLNWISTLRPRLGYVFGQRFMPFITGGLAIASANSSLTTASDIAFNNGSGSTTEEMVLLRDTDDDIRFGWTVGGGIDVCVSEHWILNVTYLYVDLQNADLFTTRRAANEGDTFDFTGHADANFNVHVLRAGLSYNF